LDIRARNPIQLKDPENIVKMTKENVVFVDWYVTSSSIDMVVVSSGKSTAFCLKKCPEEVQEVQEV
jgi:hypothetical protein